MIEDAIARKYGFALFQLSESAGVTDRCLEELSWVASLLLEQQKLKNALTHPLISHKDKISILEQIGSKKRIHDVTRRFLDLLIAKDRFIFFDKIYDFYQESVIRKKNIQRVSLDFAFPINKEREDVLKDRVKKIFDLENAEFSVEYNKSLIGGMVITIGDMVIDGSLSGKLKSLHQELIK